MDLTKILLMLVLSGVCESANILGFFFIPSRSHHMVFQTIWKDLAKRGHNVTVLTTDTLNDPTIKNLREIDLSISYEYANRFPISLLKDPGKYSLPQIYKNLNEWQNDILEIQFQQEEVQKFFNNTSQTFDVILAEIHSPIVHVFGKIFNAPVIGISSHGMFLNVHDAVGNPTHPILTPDVFLSLSGNPTFFDKVNHLIFFIWYRLYYHLYLLPRTTEIARKYFGDNIPYLGDLEKNVSLLMLNVNPFIHPIRPRVPAVIELEYMHIKPKKPLPADLQTFLDSAIEGVIYFSLGTNLKSPNLEANFRKTIISVLSELPYKVLLKSDTEWLSNKTKNVLTKKWFPQQDLLAHPNIKAFVTQGGLHSTEEALLNGVPLIGVPFFGDQHSNMKSIVNLGIGKYIDHNSITKQSLNDAIMEVATNPKYRKNAEKISILMRDQPLTGLEKAIWWTEYVIRHQGAPHLRRNQAIQMSWTEYLLLDILCFLFAIVFLFIYITYWLTKFLINFISKEIKYKTL